MKNFKEIQNNDTEKTAMLEKKDQNKQLGENQDDIQASPEAMAERSALLVHDIENSGSRGLEPIVKRAESEGLEIDPQDRKELEDLTSEAEQARRDLLIVIKAEHTQGQAAESQRNGIADEAPPPANILKEREVITGKLLPKDISKKELASERKELAKKLREERKERAEKKKEMNAQLEELKKKLEKADFDQKECQKEYETLLKERIAKANSMAGRIRKWLGLGIKKERKLDAEIEQKERAAFGDLQSRRFRLMREVEDLEDLIKSDSALRSIKEKLKAHYDQALEGHQKSVEQTAIRNNVFFVHTIAENMVQRHNANSNVSQEATFEDDLDILLSLEPSVSASSINPREDEQGRVSGLWTHTGGVIIGGGEIGDAFFMDNGTLSTGIKNRKSLDWKWRDTSIEEIDEISKTRRGKAGDIGGYNEFIINNPEVCGYFQMTAVDKNGDLWAETPSGYKETYEIWKFIESQKSDISNNRILPWERGETIKGLENSEKYLKTLVNNFRNKMGLIQSKGLPNYVMTPDRRLFECLGISENGKLQIGKELTPAQVATGRAGLPADKRREIGKKLLEKSIFRGQSTQKEAAEIVSSL